MSMGLAGVDNYIYFIPVFIACASRIAEMFNSD